jgi:UDP-glucose 4-epimerase
MMPIDKPNALVTGVAGFIGSRLAERLLSLGWRVVGIDCLTTNYDPQHKRANLSTLLAHPHFTFLELALHELSARTALPPFNYVFHAAGRPGVRSSFGPQFPLYVRDNILATNRLLDRCLDGPVQKFVYVSSSSAYGNCHGRPVKESQPTRPASPYAMTKLAAEVLCHYYARRHYLPVVSARLFTVYGPGQRPDMAAHRFIEAVLEGRPVEIYGDGRQTRDLTFVDDAVRGLVRAALFGRHRGIYNIASGRPISILDLVERISRLACLPVEVQFTKPQQGDVDHTWGDIQRAQRELGYTPSMHIDRGLRQQIEAIQAKPSPRQGALVSNTIKTGGA